MKSMQGSPVNPMHGFSRECIRGFQRRVITALYGAIIRDAGGGHYKSLTTGELTLGGKVVSLPLVSASDIFPKKYPLHQFLSL